MTTNIKCPRCGHSFPMEQSIREEIQQEFRQKWIDAQKKKDEERQRKEQVYVQQIEELRTTLTNQGESLKEKINLAIINKEEEIRRKMELENEAKVKHLEKKYNDAETRINILVEKELESLELKNELDELKRNNEFEKKKYLLENSSKLIEDALKKQNANFDFEKREMQIKIDQQRKQVEEMTRKLNQGSMQVQGEAQELVLEDKLREYFPYDTIVEVGKGVEGADCIMIVRNALGSECGKIIFESKRAKGWNNTWIDKLKNDMRNKQADLAILVTQVFPKGMDCFGEKDGVWLCSFKELPGLAAALRNAIVRIAETKKSEENKGEKMQMLYNYLTGLEFRQQIEAIVEGFVSMKNSILKERIQMERLWKEREKQLDKVLLNTSGMYGSVKGIAGASVQNIPLLEGTADDEDDITH
jgi:hypothetical protein